jgi:hypothetical protein
MRSGMGACVGEVGAVVWVAARAACMHANAPPARWPGLASRSLGSANCSLYFIPQRAEALRNHAVSLSSSPERKGQMCARVRACGASGAKRGGPRTGASCASLMTVCSRLAARSHTLSAPLTPPHTSTAGPGPVRKAAAVTAPPAGSCVKVATVSSKRMLCTTTRPSASPNATTSSAGDGATQRTAAPKPAKVCTTRPATKLTSAARPSAAHTRTLFTYASGCATHVGTKPGGSATPGCAGASKSDTDQGCSRGRGVAQETRQRTWAVDQRTHQTLPPPLFTRTRAHREQPVARERQHQVAQRQQRDHVVAAAAPGADAVRPARGRRGRGGASAAALALPTTARAAQQRQGGARLRKTATCGPYAAKV